MNDNKIILKKWVVWVVGILYFSSTSYFAFRQIMLMVDFFRITGMSSLLSIMSFGIAIFIHIAPIYFAFAAYSEVLKIAESLHGKLQTYGSLIVGSVGLAACQVLYQLIQSTVMGGLALLIALFS